MNGTVTYAYSRTGYEVTVSGPKGNVIEEYSAGNHRLDSQQRTDDPRSMLPLQTIHRYARQTSLEMATEHGVLYQNVSVDQDRMHDLADEAWLAQEEHSS